MGIPMSLHYAILGVLTATPMSGYELGTQLSSSMQWVWAAPLSQIYPTLSKLEERGLVTGTEERTGRRSTVRYSITDAGRASLSSWLRTPQPVAPTRDPVLLQGLLLDLIDDESARAILEQIIDDERARAAHWRGHAAQIRAGATSLIRERLGTERPADHPRMIELKARTFDGMADTADARGAWAQAMIEALDSGADASRSCSEVPGAPARSSAAPAAR